MSLKNKIGLLGYSGSLRLKVSLIAADQRGLIWYTAANYFNGLVLIGAAYKRAIERKKKDKLLYRTLAPAASRSSWYWSNYLRVRVQRAQVQFHESFFYSTSAFLPFPSSQSSQSSLDGKLNGNVIPFSMHTTTNHLPLLLLCTTRELQLLRSSSAELFTLEEETKLISTGSSFPSTISINNTCKFFQLQGT